MPGRRTKESKTNPWLWVVPKEQRYPSDGAARGSSRQPTFLGHLITCPQLNLASLCRGCGRFELPDSFEKDKGMICSADLNALRNQEMQTA